MTRLKKDDIQDIPRFLPEYDKILRENLGVGLAKIAALSWGMDETDFVQKAASFTMATVPLTCGQGEISGFSQVVRAITAFLGCPSFVTKTKDAAGWAEALARGADGIFAADDQYFVAVSPARARCVDNSLATGLGFTAALNAMCGGFSNQKVLILGCGPVGEFAAQSVIRFGGCPVLCDILPGPLRDLGLFLEKVHKRTVEAFTDPEAALCAHKLVVDATPSGGFIHKRHLGPGSMVAAPGVPPGPTRNAAADLGPRLFHDPLQTGVAVMAAGLMSDLGPRDLFPFSNEYWNPV